MFRTAVSIGLVGLALLVGCSDEETADPADPSVGGQGAGTLTGGSGAVGGSLPATDVSVAVEHYRYQFELTSAAATSTLTARVGAPGGSCATFDSDLLPTSALCAGQPCGSLELVEGRLRACGAPLAEGAELALQTTQTVPEQTYLSGLDVGFSRLPSLGGGTFSYVLSWFRGCPHFGPCDANPGTLARFDIEVSHPVGTTVLCPGTLVGGDELTHCTIDGPLAPTYSAFALAADESWQRSSFATAGGVEIVFFEGPSAPLAQSLEPAAVVDAFEWLVDLLGPYPWGTELRVAGGPTAWLGFEHPANIILYEELPSLSVSYADGPFHVLVHEIVHQWAGARVTPASDLDFVWKEAIAEYLTYVIEDELGTDEQAAESLAYWDQISRYASYHPRPTDDPAPAIADFYGDAYGPGPMVLFIQLEPLLGRETVLAGIQSFLTEPGVRSVADLQAAMEQASGEDLTAYYDAWVFGAGAPSWPSFSASHEQVDSEVTVTLEQQSGSGELYGCAVEVLVEGASSTSSGIVEFGLDPTSATASVVVTLAEPVVRVIVDPAHRVIDVAPPTSRNERLEPRPTVWLL